MTPCQECLFTDIHLRMKKVLLVIFLLTGWIAVYADHIVGGEIEFITIRPGLYRINLIQYFDAAQIFNPGPESGVNVGLFTNRDDEQIGNTLFLPLIEQTEVFYTNIACTIAELKTSRVLWSAEFELDPLDFTDEEGYYITWDRCCRNDDVINVIGSGIAGMLYIVDIPPLYKNGRPFINSSPILNRPLSDYACVGQFYYTNFIGTDPDGDSLVYRLATPLNSKIAGPDPGRASPEEAEAKPVLEIRWANGFSLENAIPGTPALKVSGRGLLTVTPSQAGLFVFSVIVEEWRFDNLLGESVKIGEVQRDFQMLVIDGCGALPPPPVLDIVIPGDPGFDPSVDILNYESGDDKCFQFFVSNVEEGRNISLRAEPVNFDGEYDVLGDISFTIGSSNEILVDYCAPDCPPIRDRPFLVDFIVEDDVCPLPQLDTVRLSIQVEPPPNAVVDLSSTNIGPYNLKNGESVSFDFVATDADNDTIDVSFVFDDLLTPEERGIAYNITLEEEGRVEGTFSWEVDCNAYDLSDEQSFEFMILAEDRDQCRYEDLDQEQIYLNAILPANTNPTLNTSSSNIISVAADTQILFEIDASDADGDSILLRIDGDGFDPYDFGVDFQSVSGFGDVSSGFKWTPYCDSINLLAKDQYDFLFIVEDFDVCNAKNSDTLIVQINVEIPENSNPLFSSIERSYKLELNEPFELNIEASDSDNQDELVLQFHDSFRTPISESLSFEPVTGFETVNSILRWTPECRLLPITAGSAYYDLYFIVTDNSCPIVGLDTMKLTFEIVETREAFKLFDPPNVFTPNGDDWNNTFTLTGHSDSKRNLPKDNCEDTFDFILIQDRSGKVVFESNRRDFEWNGEGAVASTYYYFIKYTQTEYKGYVTLLR